MTARSRNLPVAALVLAIAALSIVAAWPAIARAAAEPTKIAMQAPTQLPVQKSHPESVMVLGATLTSAAGKPLSNQRVEFVMATDILGQKKASIGFAVTDSGGSARTTFVVLRTGSYELSARFAGTDAFGASESPVLKAEFQTLAPPPTHAPPHEQLALNRIGRWVPWAGLSLVVGVWVTLAYVMASVLIIVPRAGRRDLRRG